MKFSVVLPQYNHWELTHVSLMGIYRNCYFPHAEEMEIILIDDASTEGDCATGVAFWQGIYNKTGNKTLRYHRNEQNLGFGGSMNYGVRMAKGEIIVLLSNDVSFGMDILGLIAKTLEDNPKSLVSGELIGYPAGWNEFDFNGRNVYVPYCNGWLLACKKEAWEQFGGFDPRYGRYDFEDVDLSTKAQELGYNLVALNNPTLKHVGGATIYSLGIDRMAHTKENRTKFIAKWGEKLLQIGKSYG